MSADAPRIDAVSFDLDGTLVDTAAEIAAAVNATLVDFGIGARPLDEIERLIGDGAHALMRKLLRQLAEGGDRAAAGVDEVLHRLDHHYALTAGTTCVAYAGCRATLDRLRDADVRLACTTNKEHAHARRVLEATRLAEAFELVIGGDSLPVRKPHPAVLGHVGAVLGTDAARLAHVGDSQTDVEAARNAGAHAWAVPWGYNAGLCIADARPARLFDSLPAIADHVLAARPKEDRFIFQRSPVTGRWRDG